MLEGIPWQTVGTILTPVGLYMLGFILMMRGEIIPYSEFCALSNTFSRRPYDCHHDQNNNDTGR